MKKLLLSIVAGLFITANIHAQTALPILNCETSSSPINNGGSRGATDRRNYDIANCWTFGGVSYTDIGAISNFYSAQSGQATSLLVTSFWIKSPWIKPGSGNITLKAKLTASNGTVRKVHIAYLPYDAVTGNSAKEGTRVEFNVYDFTTINTTVNNLSIPIPAAIANSSVPYKIMISLAGSGGNSRIMLDDLTIPSTYFADPLNSCLPQVQILDKDGDGVADADDAFPEDKEKAYIVQIPNATPSTLMFEDLWPATGDYDFNDFVAIYQAKAITNANNNVVEVIITTQLNAVGASFDNGFAVQFDGLSPIRLNMVNGSVLGTSKWIELNEVGSEQNQDFANIIIFDKTSSVLKSAGGSGINVNPEGPFVKPETVEVTVEFNTDKEFAIEVKDLKLNPYIIVNGQREVEVHLPDYAPTNLASKKLFGTGVDYSNPEKGTYYKTKNNLPFAIKVEGLIPHMVEKQDILTGYPKLADWAKSEGQEYENWYDADKGFRENKLLIYLEGIK